MATRYGRAGGAWSAAGTWSATSGGGSDGTGLATGDDVVLDAASSGTFLIDASISIRSLDCNGFAGTLNHNGAFTVTISGNDGVAPGGKALRLSSGMTYTAAAGTRIFTFTSTSGTATVTSNGKTLGTLIVNGAGGTVQLLDALTIRVDGSITLTTGTLDLNNQNVSVGYFLSNNSNTRVLTMGSGTLTITGTSVTVWDCTVVTGMTINKGTSTLAFHAAATGQRTILAGGKAFATVSLANSGTISPDFIFGTNPPTIDTLVMTAPVILGLTAGTTTTINNALALSGVSASNFIVVKTTGNTGAASTIACTAGGTIQWAVLANITFTGGAMTATDSFDGKGNTGVTITAPSSGGGGSFGMVGG